MHKMVQVSEVAGLAKEIEKSRNAFLKKSRVMSSAWFIGWNTDALGDIVSSVIPTDDSTIGEESIPFPATQSVDQSSKLIELLEQWEEPDRSKHENVSTFAP